MNETCCQMYSENRLSMKRGTGGKEPGEHCWILFAIIGNGLQLLGKRHMAAVLGAQTQGETHRQNDTSLAGRPKDTNPYPGRDPYRGIHEGGRRPKAAAPLCGFLCGWVCGSWGDSRRGRNTRKCAPPWASWTCAIYRAGGQGTLFCVFFAKTKKTRSARTIILSGVSRRDLCYASGNTRY